MKINKVLLFFIVGIILYIYHPVYILPIVVGGDYISPLYMNYLGIEFPFSIWDSTFSLGMGIGPLLHYAPVNFLLSLIFSVTPIFADRILWWGMFLLIGFGSSYYLALTILGRKFTIWIAPLIFLLNTYILLILSGGQIAGIGLGYAVTPLLVVIFYKIQTCLNQKGQYTLMYSLLYGCILTFQLLFDFRVAYMTLMLLTILFLLFQFIHFNLNKLLQSFLFVFVIPGIITILFNSFWLIPTLIFRSNPIQELGSAYNSLEAVKFFSFAAFENSISLLHPYWPENIFGKVGFMRPEFLVIPILAFSSLLFIKNEKKERKITILTLALIGLLGGFLAKGAHEPFGDVYLWAFDNIPGFVMFRDPTKWYLLVVISYTVLIPYTVSKTYDFLKLKLKGQKYVPYLWLLLFFVFWLFTIRQAVFGELGGTFEPHSIPKEYKKLHQFLISQDKYFRTFWIPATQRFGFNSKKHPAVSGRDLYHVTTASDVIKNINTNSLSEITVKYIIVPFDSEGEIFLKDRKYNAQEYEHTIQQLERIPWLKRVEGFDRIAVFETQEYNDHFWVENNDAQIQFSMLAPTKYVLNIKNASAGGKIIFSENFDKNWVLRDGKHEIHSSVYSDRLNSFVLPRSGDYTAFVYYTPQDWVNRGLVISGVSFISVLGLLVWSYKKKK